MRKSLLIILGLIAVTALLLFYRGRDDSSGPADSETKSDPRASSPGSRSGERSGAATPAEPRPKFYDFPKRLDPPKYRVPPDPNDSRITRTDDGKVLLNTAIGHAKAMHDPEIPPSEDLEHLASILMLYRWAYQQNPVGGNDDIVRQLTGDNPKKIVVIPPDHPSISSTGELLDRYGNPYLFHAISETEMGIWSFGPDGVIGTVDDEKLEESGFFEENDTPTE